MKRQQVKRNTWIARPGSAHVLYIIHVDNEREQVECVTTPESGLPALAILDVEEVLSDYEVFE